MALVAGTAAGCDHSVNRHCVLLAEGGRNESEHFDVIYIKILIAPFSVVV